MQLHIAATIFSQDEFAQMAAEAWQLKIDEEKIESGDDSDDA
jgi:hypothetical protein